MRATRGHQVVVAALACLALGACGSDDEPKGKQLPRAATDQLVKRLDEIERRYVDAVTNDNVGACQDIQDDSFDGDGGIQDVLAELPGDIDPDLRTAVDESFSRLRQLAQEGCADVKPPEPVETVPEPEPLPEETVPEETVPEETVPEETTPEETVPQQETIPQPQMDPRDQGQGGGAEPPAEGRD